MLAMAQYRGRPVGAVAQADPGKQRATRLAQFLLGTRIAPELERMPGVRLHRQGNIVEHAEIEKQRGDLERARKAECATLISRQGGDVGTGKANAAGIRL